MNGSPLARLGRDLLDLLLAPACPGCGGAPARAGPLCGACDARLPRLAQPRDPRPPAPLALAVAAAPMEAEVETWLHRFKYPAGGLRGLDPGPGAVVRGLACEAARETRRALLVPARRVVPVPLHPRRLAARGFNPAAVLARTVARELGLPWSPRALARLRDTPSQTGLGRGARRRNVAGAFRATEPVAGRVILVDDVVTTGATAAAAARALRRAGARAVVLVTAARTPLAMRGGATESARSVGWRILFHRRARRGCRDRNRRT